MIFYHVIVLVALLVGLGLLLWNLCQFQSLRVVPSLSPEEESAAPMVSILVPARNEELRIGACAGSLARQRYPRFEVLVLDDNSEDGTGEVLRALGFVDVPGASLRVLKGEPLPAGWTGKGWACHQLAAVASGEYLLFVDADTEHAPEMLASAVAMAKETRADLLSAWPRLLMRTWSEKLILPLIHLSLVYYPHALFQMLQDQPETARKLPRFVRRGFGGANGQFLLFRKEAYERIGGHAAVRAHMVEDVALGREVSLRMGEGMRLINCDGSPVCSVRMYTAFPEVWEGFTKNVRAAFEKSLWLYFAAGFWMAITMLLPFGWVGLSTGVALWLVIAQVLVIYLIRACLTLRFQTSWFGALMHPFALIVMNAIALNSWRCSAGKGVTWKGRRYDVVHPK